VTAGLHVDKSVVDFAVTLSVFFRPVFSRSLFKAAKLRIMLDSILFRGSYTTTSSSVLSDRSVSK
jgi:hypothetical protein